MPAYNAANFIGETLDSVLNQTYKNWELLVTNDCSNDGTMDILNDYRQLDARIKPLQNKINRGPAVARNTAIARIQGDFLAFLDSDDLWLPQKLERQLTFSIHNRYAFTHTAYRRFFTLEKLGRYVAAKSKITYTQYCQDTSILTSAVLIDLRQTGRFQMKDEYYDDLALWLELMRRGFPSYGLDEDLVRYRIRPGSISRNKLRSAYHVWDTIYRIEENNFWKSGWYFSNYLKNMVFKFIKNKTQAE